MADSSGRPCKPSLSYAPHANDVFPLFQAGALAGFLKDLLLTDVPYADLVEADFKRCIEVHFQDIGKVGKYAESLSTDSRNF